MPGGIIRILRARLAPNRRRFVVPVPPLPLGGGREAALVRFALDIRRAGTARRPWIRTPRRCPAGGWTTTYAPLFDTLGRVTLRDASPCRRP